MNATLATTTTAAAELDLFGAPLRGRTVAISETAIVSKTDATKVLGRRVLFDTASLKDFKAKLAENKSLTAAQKRTMRGEFLHADAIKQRQLLGSMALSLAYEPDTFAPKGRVPELMELRKNGVIKLVSVDAFIGADKKETPKQKIERLEKELRALRSTAKAVESAGALDSPLIEMEASTATAEAPAEAPAEEATEAASE